MGVSRVFNGHYHDCCQYPQIVFPAYAEGFCGLADEASNVILAGEFEDFPARREWNGEGGRE